MRFLFPFLIITCTLVSNLNATVIVSTPRITPAPSRVPHHKDLHKRARWVDVCPEGSTEDCRRIGVDQILTEPEGHYIPACNKDGIDCQYIGYVEPTSSISGQTSYIITSAGGDPFIIPVPPVLPPEVIPPPPPIPPPEAPEDLPDPPNEPDPDDNDDSDDDTHNCPVDDSQDQPKCIDESCDAEDQVCTSGDHKGCKCKEDDCPDLKDYTFFCSDCGGKDGSGKCKGDPEDDNTWKGCECSNDPDWDSQIPPLRRADVKEHREALLNLPTKTSETPPSSSTPKARPSCDTKSVSRVQYNVFFPGVYTNFCSVVDGGGKSDGWTQIVDSKGNIPRKRTFRKRSPPPDPDNHADYTFELKWTGGDGSCDSDCYSAYSNITVDTCGHQGSSTNMMTTEGSLDTGCGTYSYKINAPLSSEPDPQPNPTPTTTKAPPAPSGTITCFTSVAIATASVDGLIAGLCNGDATKIDQAQPTAGQHDIPNVDVDKERLNAVGATLIADRPGCQTAEFNIARSTEVCSSYMARITQSCSEDGGAIMSAGCFDWEVRGFVVGCPGCVD